MNLWEDRRRAILLAADSLESRNEKMWSDVDDLLFQVRAARPQETQTLEKEKTRARIVEMLDDDAIETFPLPFPKLNKALLGGLRRGQTAVIAADPAHGKSIMADQIIEHMAQNGASCHLMLNEMTPADRIARWIQRRTGILEEKVLARDLLDEERELILREAESFPFDMTQIAGDSFRAVADKIRDAKVDVVAVDLLSRFDYRDERELRLGMTTLTDAAHQSNCVLIILHHLNQRRANETGFRPTPTLSDLRDSGSVGGFADIAFFLHRDHEPSEPTKLIPTGTFYAVKVRSGSPGAVRVVLNGMRLRFEEYGD